MVPVGGRRCHRTEPEPPARLERGIHDQARDDQHERGGDRRHQHRADGDGRIGPSQGDGRERQQDAQRRRTAHREPDLVVRPCDRVIHADRDRGQREADHQQGEGDVATGLAPGRHRERHPAEHAGEPDHPEDQQDTAKRGPGEDQDAQGADGIRRHPFRCQREAEQDSDRGHRRPERPAAAGRLEPQPGEQQVRREDEEADVHVVHRDPALDEEHPVEHGEQADQHADLAAPEQDPGEQVQQARAQGAEDDARQAPGKGVVVDVERAGGAVRGEHEDRAMAVGRVVRVAVEDPGRRVERQPMVCEHRLAVRLDHVHRGAAVRRDPQRIHQPRRLVVHDPGRRPGHLHRRGHARAVLGRVAGHRDDRDLRLTGGRVGARRVQLRAVLHAADEGDRGRRPVEGDRRGQGAARGHQVHATGVGHREHRDLVDPDPGEPSVVDRSLEARAHLGCQRPGQGHGVGVELREAGCIVGSVPAQDARQLRCLGRGIGDVDRRRDDGVALTRRHHVGGTGQHQPAVLGAGAAIDDRDRVAGQQRGDGLAAIERGQAADRSVEGGDRRRRDRR